MEKLFLIDTETLICLSCFISYLCSMKMSCTLIDSEYTKSNLKF